MNIDKHAIAMMETTANGFSKLAALYGVSGALIEVDPSGRYVANGENCGRSVHGLYDWVKRQKGFNGDPDKYPFK